MKLQPWAFWLFIGGTGWWFVKNRMGMVFAALMLALYLFK